MIIKAGTNIQCSQGHACGMVIRDIDTDQGITMLPGYEGGSPYSIDQSLAEADIPTGTWTCRTCGEPVVRRGSIQTERGWSNRT
jgi:hypothetical protein